MDKSILDSISKKSKLRIAEAHSRRYKALTSSTLKNVRVDECKKLYGIWEEAANCLVSGRPLSEQATSELMDYLESGEETGLLAEEVEMVRAKLGVPHDAV